MASEWKIIGQVTTIEKSNGFWQVSIADDHYKKDKNGESKKDYTIWFNCLCKFKPNVKVGEVVIACGYYLPSNNENYQNAKFIKNIGVIKEE